MTVEKQVEEAAKVVEAADLDLIDDKLADGTKDDAELWNEIAAADKPAAAAEAVTDSDKLFDGENDTETQEGAAAAAPGATEAATPDIWASAPPELKAAYDALAAEKVKVENDHKAVSGRVSAYQRKYEQLAKAAQPVKKDETESPTKAIESLMEDYPEIAKPLKQALETIEGKLNNLDKAQESLREDAQTELQTLIDDETARLEKKHPDWLETLQANGPAFAAWVEDQPRRIREIAYKNDKAIVDAVGAAEVVSLFKAHIGKPATPAPKPDPKTPNPPLNDRRERQLAGSASPQRQGGRPVVSGIPEDGDPEQIWKAFDAVDQQKQRARA